MVSVTVLLSVSEEIDCVLTYVGHLKVEYSFLLTTQEFFLFFFCTFILEPETVVPIQQKNVRNA